MTNSAAVRVCSFESRRGDEMRSLIERFGGVATVAPSMREVPVGDNPQVFLFADELLAGRVQVVVFLTGVGAEALLDAWKTRHDEAAFFAALAGCAVVVRGPKPAVVLREWGVRVDHRVPEPNTWRELLDTLDASVPVAGRTVAVQEYGEPNDELYAALRERGATVLPVPVYKWAFPEDTGPLRDAIRRTVAGEFDALVFTSAQQVANVLRAAEEEGLRDAWTAAAKNCVVASIGPTATEKLHSVGLPVHAEASPPKMGPLVRAALDAVNRKRSGRCGTP
jgi:uroporphyrinogen-III synthase